MKSRKLNILGMMLTMVLATTALSAAAASAHIFTASETPATLTGTQENIHVWTFTGKEIRCEKSHFQGTQAASPTASVRLHPTYETNCGAGGIGATVTTTGCDYIFGGETDVNGHATFSIDCNHENAIVWNAAGGACKILIEDTHGTNPVNQNLRGVHYTTTVGANGKKQVTVEATVTGIKYTVEGSLCFLAGIGTGTHEEGTYTGLATVTGTSGGNAIDVTTE